MPLITVKEAARRLSLSRGLVYALVRAGQIRHERHGLRRGTIRIPEDAIADYRAIVTVRAGPERIQAPPRRAEATRRWRPGEPGRRGPERSARLALLAAADVSGFTSPYR